MEEGGQGSTRSVTFIAPLELDCEGTNTIIESEEGNTEAEEGEIEDKVVQSPVLSGIENREEENETADQQPALKEASQIPNIEGDNLQHRETPPEPSQSLSSELRHQ